MEVLIIIVILVFAIPNIYDFVSKKNAEEREREKRRLEQERIQNAYDALVQKYLGSELTRKILTHICDGNYKNNLPEEIVVSATSIRSNLNGCPHSFDFKQNRIAVLRCKDWQVSATKAMAEAINLIMGKQYAVYEKDGVAHMELEPMCDF